MKSLTPSLLLWLSPWLTASSSAKGCNADNCARAVTGTRRGPDFPATAKSDCSKFMTTTEYGHTSTITVTTALPSPSDGVPSYASACSGTARYASACSCWGITSAVVKKTGCATTVTVSVSTPPPSGPGYEPAIPTSYADCAFDPASSNEFELLDPQAYPIVNRNGKAGEANDALDDVDPFTFSHPDGAPAGVYDIVLHSGDKLLFFAVFKSGAVGFVDTSSNGQSYVGTGDPYVTSIWSVECDGLTTAGIIGGDAFEFTVTDDGFITATAVRPTRRKRDIPVPKGFYIKPKNPPVTPAGSKCPSPVQHTVTRDPPVPVTSNGCGPEGFWGYFVPNFNFVDACNFHDVCWADCSATFDSCNTEFLNRMLAICNRDFPAGSKRNTCISRANFYHSMVSGNFGAGHYTETIQEYCQCVCNDASLTACGDKCVDTKSDPENCGDCYFHCPSGACTNGACAFNSCTGQTCETFGPCGPGGSCVCASVSGGQGFCVDGQTPCAGLADCGTSADCPLGSVCAAGTCCGRNVCITTDVCGGFNLPRDIFARGNFTGDTIGKIGGWED